MSRSMRVGAMLMLFVIFGSLLAAELYRMLWGCADKQPGECARDGRRTRRHDALHRGDPEAIDRCSAAGGGTVYFPSGTYLSGTLS